MNKLTYLLLCLVLGIGLATAQTRKVTGTVITDYWCVCNSQRYYYRNSNGF